MSGASQETEYHHVEAREWNDSREPTPEQGDAGGEPVLDPDDLGTFVVSATNAKRYRVVLVTEQAGVNAQSLERDPGYAGNGLIAAWDAADSGGKAEIDLKPKKSEIQQKTQSLGENAKVIALAVGFPGEGGANAKGAEGPRFRVKKAPPPPAAGGLRDRGMSAWHSARIEIARGVAKHGPKKTWETKGKNSGPIVDEYQKYACSTPSADAHWCGIFHVWNYGKAGFDYDRKLTKAESITGSTGTRKVIMWSTLRMIHYWKVANCKRLKFPWENFGKWKKKDDCVGWLQSNLNTFDPWPGDMLIVDTFKPLAHVAMVASYDPSTFELVTYEGNYADRAGAFRWDLSRPDKKGFFRMNWIARFNESDFNRPPEVSPGGPSPDPEIEGTVMSTGR